MAHVGDLLAELLIRYGVTHVFGQPGGQTAALYDGMARRSPRIRHILVRDERSAAYAADAFARLTGRPGVCDVTVGPGRLRCERDLQASIDCGDRRQRRVILSHSRQRTAAAQSFARARHPG